MTSLDALLNIESDDISDIKSWINSVVSVDTTDKEVKDLVMKLQFVSQDIDKSLDRLQDQLTQSIPSLKQVLSDISTEAQSLRDDFARINRDVHVIHERNQSVIGNLSEVHSVETKMSLCVDSLSEIHHWEVRLKRVNKLFEQRDLEPVSKELAQMRSRVEMLKDNMPALYEQRSAVMQGLVDKLENMVVPYLHETFEQHDYRSFRQYAQILATIQKGDEVEKQYILNRLDTIKQLLQHFSHKNKRLDALNVWFSEFLLNLLQYFQDEYEWSLQIFSTKRQSVEIVSKLIVDICDEINIELREWISIFLKSQTATTSTSNALDVVEEEEPIVDPVRSAAVTMAKLASLFEILSQFVVSVFDSRLLVNDHHSIGSHSPQSPRKRDTLRLIPNVTKLVSNLLSSYYGSTYLKLERLLLFSIFEPSPLSLSPNDGALSMMMPTPIRWIGENVLNELSFIDIQQRIDDSVSILCETLEGSHRRCIVISSGSLIRDVAALYDSFIAKYVESVDQLLRRCPYDSSKMVSPLQKEVGDPMERKLVDQGGAAKDEATAMETDNVMQLYSTSASPNPKDLNWIVDLKQAFLLQKKVTFLGLQIGDCVDEILKHFTASIAVLCDLENEHSANGTVQFHRIFQSISELKLLSKFSDIAECRTLFKRSGLSESKMMLQIENRAENILLNVMMQEIKMSINNIHALPVWTQKAGKSEQRLNLPVFHANPNEYIKKMGTHLLALVHQLESSANEEHHDERMDMMDAMVREQGDAMGHDEDDDDEAKESAKEKDKESDDPSIDSEKWLNLVLDETVQTLFMEFYKLNALTLRGTKQLIADLNYLCNVANTLYLDDPEFIYAILTVLQCKLGNANTLRTRLTSGNEDTTNNKKSEPKLRTSFQRKVATKFAILRGLNVRFV